MKNYQRVMTSFDMMQRQLVQHQEQAVSMDQLFHAQQREHKTQLEQVNRQLQDHKTRLDEANRLQWEYKTKLDEATQQLREYEAQLERTNQLQRTQFEGIRQHVRQADQQIGQADNVKAQQENQYKKQMDEVKVCNRFYAHSLLTSYSL